MITLRYMAGWQTSSYTFFFNVLYVMKGLELVLLLSPAQPCSAQLVVLCHPRENMDKTYYIPANIYVCIHTRTYPLATIYCFLLRRYDGGDCCSGQNCDLCIDPAASCSDSSSEDEKNNKTKNTNKNAKIVVGVGVGGVGLWSVGLLAIRYRRLAREKKASEAASSAHAHQRGIAGPGGGSRAIR